MVNKKSIVINKLKYYNCIINYMDGESSVVVISSKDIERFIQCNGVHSVEVISLV